MRVIQYVIKRKNGDFYLKFCDVHIEYGWIKGYSLTFEDCATLYDNFVQFDRKGILICDKIFDEELSDEEVDSILEARNGY